MLWSAYGYLFQKAMIDGVKALGFPDHFRIMLAVMKVLAVIALMLPVVTVHKDPFFFNVLNFIFLVVLAVSNVYLHKLFG